MERGGEGPLEWAVSPQSRLSLAMSEQSPLQAPVESLWGTPGGGGLVLRMAAGHAGVCGPQAARLRPLATWPGCSPGDLKLNPSDLTSAVRPHLHLQEGPAWHWADVSVFDPTALEFMSHFINTY